MSYVEEYECADKCCGGNVKNIITAVAMRYISENPKEDYAYRAFSDNGFFNDKDSLYDINLNSKIKASKSGDIAYACAAVFSCEQRGYSSRVVCFGKTEIYVNGERVYSSNTIEEIQQNKVTVRFLAKKGINTILFKFQKTPKGFGCKFGPADPIWSPFNLQSPFKERSAFSGIIYSEITDKDLTGINCDMSENDTQIKWYPELNWGSGQKPIERVFGADAKGYRYIWTKVHCNKPEKIKFKLYSDIKIFVNGALVGEADRALGIMLKYGENDILYELCTNCIEEPEIITASAKQNIYGFKALYLGEFEYSLAEKYGADYVQNINGVYTGINGAAVYKPDYPNCYIRTFVESKLFGRWTYPLGVALYGLLRTGELLDSKFITEYAKDHINLCCDAYIKSSWDYEKYGFSGVNHQMVRRHMLDDCGSFSMAVLESNVISDGAEAAAKSTADFIEETADRTENGAFYRKCSDTFMKNTMWADDLYMSVPFLIRYYKKTGDNKYIDDALHQMLAYKKYLYMEELHLMSHVYNFDVRSKTGVPWGRGNGWTLFSLTELLTYLDSRHPKRGQILGMYNELCEGILNWRDENGMWHQVINDLSSYEETSCTAMFIYGFARGARMGWMNSAEKYGQAAIESFKALSKRCIDKYGNIYGVCQGSAYSFSPEYYRDELKWNLNDTHGTGVVLLAGAEVELLGESYDGSKHTSQIC